MADVLVIRHAIAGYDETTVLHGVDLAIPAATWTTIIGANGAGKSTLLKTIAGILPCREGRILFDGRDITGLRWRWC